jgi:hypothetical protein
LFIPVFPDELVEQSLLLFSQFNISGITTIPAQFHKFRDVADPGLPTALHVSQKTSGTRFHGMPRHTLVVADGKEKFFIISIV